MKNQMTQIIDIFGRRRNRHPLFLTVGLFSFSVFISYVHYRKYSLESTRVLNVSITSSRSVVLCADQRCNGNRMALDLLCQPHYHRFILRYEPRARCSQWVRHAIASLLVLATATGTCIQVK